MSKTRICAAPGRVSAVEQAMKPFDFDTAAAPAAPIAAAGRSRRAEWINRKLAQGKLPSLDPEALIAKARAQTGLNDLGPDEIWRQSLQVLTGSIEREARLNALGTIVAHGQLVALLANRLRLQALWRRRPDILERPAPLPIIVLGQMRSGSTRVQRLLACDPRLQYTRFFESWNPAPMTRRVGPLDDRRLRGWLALFCARLLNPRFDAIHPTGTDAPDEEIGWHSISLFASAFEAQWRVPDFAAHCERIDPQPVYREFKAILQTVGWLRRSDPRRPWILKVPQFSQDLPALLAAFPDARLVCLDRDPAAIVASSASLARNQMEIQSDAVDPQWVGREWLRKSVLRDRRLREARSRAPQVQVDVRYGDMTGDWRAEMQRVYAALELPLTPEVLRRMERYSARAGRQRFSEHSYDLADFGLGEADVRAAFGQEQGLSRAA